MKVIKQNYLTNPVPTIRPSLIKYHGPADNFHNLTFGEYLDALRLFNDFHSCGDPEILYLLVAILYRPAAPFHFFQKDKGDIREVYNSHTIEKRAKKLKIRTVRIYLWRVFAVCELPKSVGRNEAQLGRQRTRLINFV